MKSKFYRLYVPCREADIEIKDRIVLVSGDSGTGKTLVFNGFKQIQYTDNNIVCIDSYRVAQTNERIYNIIKKSRPGCLVVIDNADLLLTKRLKEYIVNDKQRYYLIFGRNVDGLQINPYRYAIMQDTGKKFVLDYEYIHDREFKNMLP